MWNDCYCTIGRTPWTSVFLSKNKGHAPCARSGCLYTLRCIIMRKQGGWRKITFTYNGERKVTRPCRRTQLTILLLCIIIIYRKSIAKTTKHLADEWSVQCSVCDSHRLRGTLGVRNKCLQNENRFLHKLFYATHTTHTRVPLRTPYSVRAAHSFTSVQKLHSADAEINMSEANETKKVIMKKRKKKKWRI